MSDVLRVGTDCSGIEAPIQALRQLGIPFRHVFSSEIDKYCIQSIKANYEPEILFGDPDGPFKDGDITKRNIDDVPDMDLYVCGFPCQPFSTLGSRGGLSDKRGGVFWTCVDVITKRRPRHFLLENVTGILSQGRIPGTKTGYGETWKAMIKALDTLTEDGYIIEWKILNTRDYGIPQNRKRVYILGSLQGYAWPDGQEMEEIDTYVDRSESTASETSARHEMILQQRGDGVFVDLANVSFNSRWILANAAKYVSTIMAGSRIWCIPMHRYATVQELLWLQGFSEFKEVVSNTQLRKQIGNSMSVNVVVAILEALVTGIE